MKGQDFREAAEKYEENLIRNGFNQFEQGLMLHGYKEGYSEAKKEVREWISVKDRTPEFDGKYLCFIEAPQECGNIWRFQEVVDLHFNEWITSEDQYVTHWKPLEPDPL